MRRHVVSSLTVRGSKPVLNTPSVIATRSYSPLPVRHSKGPKGGRARAPGKLPAVPSFIQHRQLDPVSEAAPPAASGADPAPPQPGWTPPFPASTRPDVKYGWTDYDSQPVTAGADGSEEGLAKVEVTPDPQGVLQPGDPAEEILSQPALVVVRQLEMMNLFIGFEQANKYALLTPSGKTVGYLAEEDLSFGSTLTRQLAGTHRAFKATVMDTQGRVVLRMRRPFSFINSKIFVERVAEDEEDTRIVGEAQQEWHPWRRRYNLFLRRPKTNDDDGLTTPTRSSSNSTALVPSTDASTSDNYLQFARIDSGLLAWDFYPTSSTGAILSSINRNFTGFAREIFTDTGQYILRFDAVGDEIKQIDQVREEAEKKGDEAAQERARMGGLVKESQYDQRTREKGQSAGDVMPNLPVKAEAASGGLTLDQRAVLLATAVSIDFDYFTRSSSRGGLFSPH